ncbi:MULTISPECIES: redoxin domain-containing protein [Sphingobacterium]|uniref:redoxin domain-containing protein n=1 Tax=Sphingobacterium TaxID=28453 RepID=UPI00257B5C8A|nr:MULTISPECIES: redoxin domain-containing protein [Sphingobacterium]
MKYTTTYKTVLLYLLLLMQCPNIKGQEIKDVKPLAVGDTLPELLLSDILNFEGDTIRLSDYKGKAILLDFWATWCTPCVAAFPKLMDIQQRFKNDLQIILLSSDKEEKIRMFYKDRTDFPFPTVLCKPSSTVRKLFPHREIPHYILIDSDHKINAITDGTSINMESVERLIRKLPFTLYQKDDSLKMLDLRGMVVDSIDVGSMNVRTISIDSTVQYGSQISGYDWRITGGADFSRKGYENRFLEFRNYSVIALYRMAYFGLNSAYKDMVLIENPNENLDYPIGATKQDYEDWRVKHTYSYRVILPPHRADIALRYQYMQRDLKNFFGLNARFEERMVDCLVLTSKSPERLLSKGAEPSRDVKVNDRIVLTNLPLSALISSLGKFGVNYTGDFSQQRLPIINETGITENIDVSLMDIYSRQSLMKALERYGLKLEKQKRNCKVLVIK